MCFGRPYLPVTIYSLGIIVMISLSYKYDELTEWIEKLSAILSVLSLNLEYFLFAFQYWIKKHKKEDVYFATKMLIIGSFILLLLYTIIYFYYPGQKLRAGSGRKASEIAGTWKQYSHRKAREIDWNSLEKI